MSVGEVVATLNVIRIDITEQQQLALVAADRMELAGRRLVAVIGASASPHARAVVHRVAATALRLREAARLLAEADQAIGEYVAVITGGTEAAPVGRPASSPAASTFARTQPARSAIDEIRPHVGRDVAAGRLYDTSGRPLTPLVGPGDTGAGSGLAEPLPSMRFITHIEANATGYMRRHRVRQAVLYTNMRPCLGEDGCAQNIRATLPAGYRLTVYQVRPNGGVRAWLFDGTGEGVTTDERA